MMSFWHWWHHQVVTVTIRWQGAQRRCGVIRRSRSSGTRGDPSLCSSRWIMTSDYAVIRSFPYSFPHKGGGRRLDLTNKLSAVWWCWSHIPRSWEISDVWELFRLFPYTQAQVRDGGCLLHVMYQVIYFNKLLTRFSIRNKIKCLRATLE